MSQQTHTLNPEMIDQFAEDGAIILRGLFSDWVEPLRNGIEKLMTDPSPLERSYQPEDGTARFFQDLCNWQRIDEFRSFVHESPAAEIAAKLMHSNTGRFFHDHVLVKEPGTSIVTPWHQDQPYYCTDGRQSVSFWIPLDDVPQETSLRCVAGSHRWGKDHRPKRFDGSNLYEQDDYEELPDIDNNLDQYRILSWALAPGDAVAFNFRTVHGAAANTGQSNRRRAFSARWVGDDAIFRDRKGKGSPPFRQLTLEDGKPLAGDEFPLVYGG
ncbi:MAG: phytanoyl-CoA dioxygenase family protein [Gammaproteobacteria bacterium]|nr:phytanoyl-CoA dioxygenase family protein [Gammaproteobacteria bacterium]